MMMKEQVIHIGIHMQDMHCIMSMANVRTSLHRQKMVLDDMHEANHQDHAQQI